MQINVMPWLTVAWALLLAALAQRRALSSSCWPCCRSRRWSVNVAAFARWRGGDAGGD